MGRLLDFTAGFVTLAFLPMQVRKIVGQATNNGGRTTLSLKPILF
jgi:hypothetical protein